VKRFMSVRYNYIERHCKLYQEQINCSIYHEKKGIYTIYTTIKPLNKKSTNIFIEIIKFLSRTNIRRVIGDTFVMIKKILKECKELGIEYIGKLRKNIIIEFFGKRVKVEELFEKDFREGKFKLRTINGVEFKLSDRIVNIPNVGRVKNRCSADGKPKNSVLNHYKTTKRKWRIIIIEYMKRSKIEEKYKGINRF